MKIGIISDTHDHHQNVLKAVDIFNQHKVDLVLHAGDIISPFSARAFENVKNAKFIAVFGNNDGDKLFLQSTINGFGGEIHNYSYTGTLDGKQVYMTHTPHDIEQLARSQSYDLIIYGHTHKQDIRRLEKTLIINPGEATDWITGAAHLVILDTADMNYQIISIQ